MAGLEVEEIRFIGLPIPGRLARRQPDRDRMEPRETGGGLHFGSDAASQRRPVTLCKLFDGQQEQRGSDRRGRTCSSSRALAAAQPLKVAYAKEGAQIYDGHAEGSAGSRSSAPRSAAWNPIRWSARRRNWASPMSMKAYIILDDAAPAGMPLVDYLATL